MGVFLVAWPGDTTAAEMLGWHLLSLLLLWYSQQQPWYCLIVLKWPELLRLVSGPSSAAPTCSGGWVCVPWGHGSSSAKCISVLVQECSVQLLKDPAPQESSGEGQVVCMFIIVKIFTAGKCTHKQTLKSIFLTCFPPSCLRSIYVLLTIIKYRLFQCKLCEISGLPSYSQRLKLHIFLLTSLHLNFEVWLWKSLAHPCKTNGKTQRTALFGITQGCLRRYYLCLSQSTAKMISLLLKNQSIPFLCTHLPRGKAEQQRYSTPSLF